MPSPKNGKPVTKGDAPKPRPRRVIDWEKVELDYRAGVKSLRVIAAENGLKSEGAIRKKAKENGWERGDLAKKVRKEVRNQLVRTAVRTDPPSLETEEDAVKANAAIGVAVIGKHRAAIDRLRNIGDKLAERLEKLIDGTSKPEELGVCLGTTETPTQMLNRLTSTLDSLIKLERQAFNLDDAPLGSEDNPVKAEGTFKIEFVKAAHDQGDGPPTPGKI